MPEADLVAIADAVRSSFDAAYGATPRRLSQPAFVERTLKPTWKLDELTPWSASGGPKAIRISVAPVREEQVIERRLRGIITVRSFVYVALAAKLKEVNNTNTDALHYLLQEMRDYFFRNDAAYGLTGRQERAIDIETLNHPDPDLLMTAGHFVGDFLLTFEGVRTV